MSYKILNFISGGTTGLVCRAESNNGDIVAIKIINISYLPEDKYKRLYREICILKHLDSKFCLSLLDSYAKYQSVNSFDIHLVLQYMEYDLFTLMKKFNLTFIQNIQIMYQILLGLAYLCKCGIIHRDIKPSNIGINENMTLRILDFGLARDKHIDLTAYVVTRWYRPLEVFCKSQYTTAVDVWSAGCIAAELFTKKVLFQGKNQSDQCSCIFQIMGWPNDETLEAMNNQDTVSGLRLFESMASSTNQLNSILKEPVKMSINSIRSDSESCCNDVLTLIGQMLDLNPDKRITAFDTLSSPVFLNCQSNLSDFVENGSPRVLQFSNNAETDKYWKDKIIEEIGN